MSDSVLVTGGGGFVGSAVVRRLVGALDAGTLRFADGSLVRRVVALLRPGGSDERLRELPRNGAWSIERADLADATSLRAAVARAAPRAIVHAALPDGGAADPVATLEVLVRSLAGVPRSRLIHTGSAWVLAPGDRLGEDAPVDPRSAYARAKLREDEALPAHAAAAGVEWLNLRLFNVFGRYERPARLVPYLVAQLVRGETAQLSHGAHVRDFTDVDAAAGAYEVALHAPTESSGRLYHIGSGRPTPARELALTVAEQLDGVHLLRFGTARTPDEELPSLVADPTRARDVLGWSAPSNLEETLRDVVAWWLDRLGGGTVAAGPRAALAKDGSR